MWRLSLRRFPSVWKAAILVAAFALGALFDNYVKPWVRRDVGVWTLRGKKGEGCKGDWGMTMIMFGRPMGQGIGVYEIPCDEFSDQSDTSALLCDCD
jgi:hypothetical protein